jgi:hypothetical protein
MLLFQKKNSLKLILIGVGSFIAALGTISYGFRFATIFNNYSYFLFLVIGCIFAVTAFLANAALGASSLLNVNIKQKLINPFYLAVGSIVSAIPYGFICYFGYEQHLPFVVNLILSLTVVVINAGIAYSAIYNFLTERFNSSRQKNSTKISIIPQIGFIIGFLVSVTIYTATVHGLTNLLMTINGNRTRAFYTACILGIFAWVPFAALFSNSTRVVCEKICIYIKQNSSKIASINKFNLIILVIAIGSGGSFAQIAIDFFDPNREIPLFFKNEIIQTFIYNFLIPCAFFSSSAVNYLALQKLYQRFF